MHNEMRIGELAARFNLNPKTIRYYEEIGLLPQADRSASGYRRYEERDVERLGFIRRAKALGLSLDEIRAILATRTEGEPPCGQVLSLIAEKIREIDQRIPAMQTLRTELAALRADWVDEHGNPRHVPAPICPIIERQTEVGEHAEAVQAFELSARR
jgi:DNA-binding transcriptional MerR regulator